MIFNNKTSIILSKRLKELREERGISQETLLEQLNSAGIKISLISLKNYEVTEQHHSKFLAVNGMNTEFLFNIAEFYGISIDYLLGRTDTRSPNPDIQSACEYTGLSEKSIEKLKRTNHFNADGSENPDKSFIDILDRFIQSKYFSELIVYWESLHTHSTEWKEKELEEKHWNECGQIAHYSDENAKLKELLRKAVEVINREISSFTTCEECNMYDEETTECNGNAMDKCSEIGKWRYADEALALIGEDTNVPASADDTNVGGKIDSWISCKDKMPEDNTSVLFVYVSENGVKSVHYGYHQTVRGLGSSWGKISGGWRYCDDDVTHWQPVPEPPKDGETE